MKILIIGYGSIGKRHFSLLKEFSVDLAVVTQRKDVDIKTFNDLQLAINEFKPNVVFVCNETHKHWETLKTCLKDTRIEKIIVEKPLSSHLDEEVVGLDSESQNRIYVSYNLRFSPLLKTLKEEIKDQKIYDVVVNVGQDLNQWRDRKGVETYSASKSRGGGVLRDLSHELDYIQWIFGPITESIGRVSRVSDLTIDSEDLVHTMFVTQRCPYVFLRLSYLDKDSVREIRVNTKDATYVLNFLKGVLYKNGKVLIEQHFVQSTFPIQADQIIKQNFRDFCTYSEAVSVMKLIHKLEAH